MKSLDVYKSVVLFLDNPMYRRIRCEDNHKLKVNIWKEEVMAYLKLLFQNPSAENEENHLNFTWDTL
jgi:hypothetical protein